MKIKLLEWQPYINNNEVHEIFGEISYIKDDLNNILFYYLIIFATKEQKNYHIMIAGQMHKEKFVTQEFARIYCQKHFDSVIKNITEKI